MLYIRLFMSLLFYASEPSIPRRYFLFVGLYLTNLADSSHVRSSLSYLEDELFNLFLDCFVSDGGEFWEYLGKGS